jgi:hypothetical protein
MRKGRSEEKRRALMLRMSFYAKFEMETQGASA